MIQTAFRWILPPAERRLHHQTIGFVKDMTCMKKNTAMLLVIALMAAIAVLTGCSPPLHPEISVGPNDAFTPKTFFERVTTEYQAQPREVEGWVEDEKALVITLPGIWTTDDTVIWGKSWSERLSPPEHKFHLRCELADARDMRSIKRGSTVTMAGTLTRIKVHEFGGMTVKMGQCRAVE